MVSHRNNAVDGVSILNKNITETVRLGSLSLHDAVYRREPGRPEASLSSDELLSLFRTADPTRNGACLQWLLRTYAAGGYLLEDLSKAHDTLVTFARLRGLLPNTATIDGEIRNPRKLGSHVTLASLWTVIAPFVEAERSAQEDCSGEQVNTDRECALSQSWVLYRSNRMVIAVPMTVEASCWWGQGTQWCTAARNNNAFEQYHKEAPLIVICLRKVGDLPARKLQLYVHASGLQFMDENDAEVSPELISERWQDLEVLFHWIVMQDGEELKCVPEHVRTEALCTAAVGEYGMALADVPWPLKTEAICLAAVEQDGRALYYVPKLLRNEAICTAAVTQDGHALKHVPEALRTEAICLAAVEQDGRALQYVPKPLRTEAVCTAAVCRDGQALEDVPKPLRTEAICTAAVAQNGRALTYIPKPLRAEAVCITAVGRNGWMIQHVPSLLLTEMMCMTAVVRNGRALQHVPEPLRTEAICLAAVGGDGRALVYVPNHLRTEAIRLAAVSSNGWALNYVPEPLSTEALCLAAVEQDVRALDYVPADIMYLVSPAPDMQNSVPVLEKPDMSMLRDKVLTDLKYLIESRMSNLLEDSPVKIHR